MSNCCNTRILQVQANNTDVFVTNATMSGRDLVITRNGGPDITVPDMFGVYPNLWTPAEVTNVTQIIDFAQLTGPQITALMQVLDFAQLTTTQITELMNVLDFTQLDSTQCQDIFQCILDNGTQAQFDALCAAFGPILNVSSGPDNVVANATSTAEVNCGENLHFFSSDGSINFTVTQGSGLVDITNNNIGGNWKIFGPINDGETTVLENRTTYRSVNISNITHTLDMLSLNNGDEIMLSNHPQDNIGTVTYGLTSGNFIDESEVGNANGVISTITLQQGEWVRLQKTQGDNLWVTNRYPNPEAVTSLASIFTGVSGANPVDMAASVPSKERTPYHFHVQSGTGRIFNAGGAAFNIYVDGVTTIGVTTHTVPTGSQGYYFELSGTYFLVYQTANDTIAGSVETATAPVVTTNGINVAVGEDYIVFPNATTWASNLGEPGAWSFGDFSGAAQTTDGVGDKVWRYNGTGASTTLTIDTNSYAPGSRIIVSNLSSNPNAILTLFNDNGGIVNGDNLGDNNIQIAMGESYTLVRNSGTFFTITGKYPEGSSSATKYVQDFVIADWTGPVSGEYTIAIPFATHAITNPVIQIMEDDGAGNLSVVSTQSATINTANDVTITVTDVPDQRFDGRIVLV